MKKNYELKGYLYPIEKIKEIKNKINIILDKIKNNKISINDYQGQIEDDPQNISTEYNELIKELNKQNLLIFFIESNYIFSLMINLNIIEYTHIIVYYHKIYIIIHLSN